MFLSLKTSCFSLVCLHTCSLQYCSAVFPCLYENHVIQSYIIASIQETTIFTLFNLINEATFLFSRNLFLFDYSNLKFFDKSRPLSVPKRVLKYQT